MSDLLHKVSSMLQSFDMDTKEEIDRTGNIPQYIEFAFTPSVEEVEVLKSMIHKELLDLSQSRDYFSDIPYGFGG